MKKWFSRLICRIFGHDVFICEGCEKALDMIWTFGQPYEWRCETPGCQDKCRRDSSHVV